MSCQFRVSTLVPSSSRFQGRSVYWFERLGTDVFAGQVSRICQNDAIQKAKKLNTCLSPASSSPAAFIAHARPVGA